ncbi:MULTISPECIES: MarR family winged helix-turn-helix transcriptional regulator [unclassified Nonomuraea]|uniref:MarR family winged helix-turn-helix transcriptional regulator n=1 Tax=Nonomuraea sp. NPDC003804 TaxID=3154547 RepID=UPI0033B69DF6
MNWLNETEYAAWIGYRRMRLLLDLEIQRDLMRESGLSEPDYDVLSNLSEAPEHRMRLTELAVHMRWSKSRLSHHITRMAERGLVSREEVAHDARGAAIVLTSKGLSTIKEAAPGHVASVRRHFIDLLTEDELRAIAQVARTVLARLE